MTLTQQYADRLTELFPSRISAEHQGVTISAAALTAYTINEIQSGRGGLEVARLMVTVGIAYSGGACGDLEADMPAITANIDTAEGKATLARVVREMVRDGYDAASGKMAHDAALAG